LQGLLYIRPSKKNFNFSVFDISAVFAVLKIIDSFFSSYELKKSISSLNTKFDYNILKKAIKVILDHDHSLSVAKLLWFYYKNFHIMSFEHVAEVFLRMFETKFFNMFLHWSWQVRNVFYFIILFIIDFRVRSKHLEEGHDFKGIRRNVDKNEIVANYPETVKFLFKV